MLVFEPLECHNRLDIEAPMLKPRMLGRAFWPVARQTPSGSKKAGAGEIHKPKCFLFF